METIHERLNLGGVLILSSPYTCLEEFTQKHNCLDGIRLAGDPLMTLDALPDLLAPHFVMLGTPQDIEFVILETLRKFQHTIADLTAWERVG